MEKRLFDITINDWGIINEQNGKDIDELMELLVESPVGAFIMIFNTGEKRPIFSWDNATDGTPESFINFAHRIK